MASLGLVTAALGVLVALALWVWPHGYPGRVGAAPAGAGLTLALALAGSAAALSLGVFVRLRRLARAQTAELGDLRAAGEILRAILGTTGKGVILADPGLRIRIFNPAAEILFRRLCDETLSVPVTALIPSLATPAAVAPAAGEAAESPRVRHCHGVRAGVEFPARLLLRNLTLDGAPWLLILVEDLTESERAEARLDYLEHHDPLTGLSNRRTIERLIGASIADPERAERPHALCLIDLDHFKIINATCGHAAGDKLLKQLGRIIAARLPTATAMARLGGDEFAALFVGDAVADAPAACEALVRTLRSFPFTWEGRSYDLTISVGIADFEPTQGALIALGRADIACQVAKTQGGGRLHRYSPEDTGSMRCQGDLELVSSIGRALDADRFRVVAQPIRPLLDPGAPTHYEILVRMQDDQGRLVAPDDFIPAAERYVLMPTVDRWILAHVLRSQAPRLRRWHARYPDRFLFAVNLSATTLVDEGFLPYLQRQFRDYCVPYPSICFEVTETAAVSDLGRARAFMQRLCDLGSCFAVDDFGTGFASYTYVKSLPIRYLKIDGSFVHHLIDEPVDRAFVESINHIGHVLGLQTIAEWAETPAVVEVLRGLGVDFAQGYGVGVPVALGDLRFDDDDEEEEDLSANERK
ncbi:diguanylate cyclase [Candidatus Thiodictyon syntrophicum]|uniref:Diguanylate cyclase n=1 Tax=Candidatus Thiodictyon syntrophicum TaxID=1166950 RepID=A0A2K8UH14_9GAMM|nr:diguanylate cyclase [Candidatus Thiodictyon syntrophicum]